MTAKKDKKKRDRNKKARKMMQKIRNNNAPVRQHGYRIRQYTAPLNIESQHEIERAADIPGDIDRADFESKVVRTTPYHGIEE